MSKNGINPGTDTRTQQQFKDDTNVGNIVRKFQNYGQLPIGHEKTPLYLDHTQFGDFTEMLNQVTQVQQSFDNYSSKMRARFENSPQKLLEYLADPENHKEAIELGIIQAPPDTETTLKDLNDTLKANQEPEPSSTPEDPQTSLIDEETEAGTTKPAKKPKKRKAL